MVQTLAICLTHCSGYRGQALARQFAQQANLQQLKRLITAHLVEHIPIRFTILVHKLDACCCFSSYRHSTSLNTTRFPSSYLSLYPKMTKEGYGPPETNW